MPYTFAEREAIKQAQVQSLLQGQAEFEGKRAERTAVTAPGFDSFKSPFGTVQSEAIATQSSGFGLSPFQTTTAREEVAKPPPNEHSASSMLLPLILIFLLFAFIYIFLRLIKT